MLLKIFIIIVFFLILSSLGRALYCMLKEPESSTKMVTALSWRIGLSIALFLFIIFCYEMKWIKPHGLAMVNPAIELQPINKDK